MRYYESTLTDEIRNPTSFLRAKRAKIVVAYDLATLLAAMHKSGIAHMDIKPDNVLISGTKAVLSDFGACVIFQDTKITGRPVVNQFGVTPEFAPPEVLAARSWADFVPTAVDVYAFGVVLFYIMTNQLPLRKRTRQEVIESVRRGDFIARVYKELPSGQVRDLIVMCVAIDHRARPNMKLVADTLSVINV